MARCLACGASQTVADAPLCKLCAEDVRKGGEDAIGRILAIKTLIDEEKEYQGDSRYRALEEKIRTLENYIDAQETTAWKHELFRTTEEGQ